MCHGCQTLGWLIHVNLKSVQLNDNRHMFPKRNILRTSKLHLQKLVVPVSMTSGSRDQPLQALWATPVTLHNWGMRYTNVGRKMFEEGLKSKMKDTNLENGSVLLIVFIHKVIKIVIAIRGLRCSSCSSGSFRLLRSFRLLGSSCGARSGFLSLRVSVLICLLFNNLDMWSPVKDYYRQFSKLESNLKLKDSTGISAGKKTFNAAWM